MSSIPQNHFDENNLIDCVQRFFSIHHVGKLLAKCNGMKEKGVSLFPCFVTSSVTFLSEEACTCSNGQALLKKRFLRTLFTVSLILQKQTGFVLLFFLAADIVNNDIRDLTDQERKNVFIIDDSLFNRTSCKKTELGSKVFDHTDMHFKKGFRMLT